MLLPVFSWPTAPRLPRTVVKRHRKRATVIWVSLIIAFVACELLGHLVVVFDQAAQVVICLGLGGKLCSPR